MYGGRHLIQFWGLSCDHLKGKNDSTVELLGEILENRFGKGMHVCLWMQWQYCSGGMFAVSALS